MILSAPVLGSRRVDSQPYTQHRLEVYAPLPCAKTPLQTETMDIQNTGGSQLRQAPLVGQRLLLSISRSAKSSAHGFEP